MVNNFIDKLVSFIVLLILSPLFIIIGLAIFIEDGSPIFFVQERLKENGNTFKMYKFRSMYVSAPPNVPTEQMNHNKNFVTKVGSFLRKTSLDELPQFYNVLRGDMALVGPRPCLEVEEELIALRKENGAFFIRPGITGLAQVSGRDDLNDAKKAEYDGVYAQNKSIWLDFKIIFRSIGVVFKKQGVKG